MAIRPVINNMDTLGTKLLLVDVKPAYERLKKTMGNMREQIGLHIITIQSFA